LQLRLSTNDLDAGDGFLEVWVISPDVTQLVSLGPLRNDGVYDLPSGLDPAAFPIVDVSVEPIDGDPTHSGASVLRGELTF
jgi:anti-sigma-K factor RskA